jgi:DNA-binding IclR family transcriptional regulator
MIQSLKKGIEALLFLASRKSVGVTELAEALEINKSTAFRILDTFLDANMVEKNKETLKYKLGPAILRLSEQYYRNYNIIADAKPLMERLAAEIRESVHLCVCANNSAVIIEQIMSDSRLVVNAKIGNSEPLHCSSVGKCLLAFAGESDREKMLSRIAFDVYTDKTIKTKEELLRELEKVRAQGYAVDDGELSEHIKCVAVPVFDEKGACQYSLGTSGAMSRMTGDKIERIIPLLLKTAGGIFTV